MQVGHRSEGEISDSAHEFLRMYHPGDTIPIPIEEIIEFELGLDIIPVPDLRRSHGIDGALAQDFSQIYVDDYVYNNWPNRHRFTLAHEIGHYILHRADLENGEVNSFKDWLDYAKSVAGLGDWFETQAHIFARHLLMPNHHLRAQFDNFLPEVIALVDAAKRNKIKRINYLEPAITAMSRRIAQVFEVSEDAARVRIITAKLDKLIP